MSRSKKWRLEWAFFLGGNGRRQYHPLCQHCACGCKQSFRVKQLCQDLIVYKMFGRIVYTSRAYKFSSNQTL